MKTKYILILTILFFSCEKGLDRYPLDGPSSATMLSTEEEVTMAVNGVYNALWMSFGYGLPEFQMTDCATDISWERADVLWQNIGNGLAEQENGVVASIWSGYYKGIGRANFILANIGRATGKIPENRYQAYIAEVKFLRAYFYHRLLALYGNIPLITDPVTSIENTQQAAATKKEVVDFLLSELDAAIPHLSPGASSTSGKASKAAALALKMRIALFDERWGDVITAGERFLSEHPNYGIDDQFGNLFTAAGQRNSREIIFTMQYKFNFTNWSTQGTDTRMAQGFSAKIPTQSLVDSYECTDGLPIHQSPLYDPAFPFRNRDPRLSATVVVPGSVYKGYQFETHKDSALCWNYNTNPATRVGNQDATNPFASFSGYCWRKYSEDNRSLGAGISEVAHIIFRFADVLLMYAEAKVESNQIDANVTTIFNRVRQRPSVNMPPVTGQKTQAEWRSLIRKERKYEFAWEGLRFLDIRRWKLVEQVMPGALYGRIPTGLLANAPVIDQNGTPSYLNVTNRTQMRVIENRIFNPARNYLLPIPRGEVQTNKLLQQNPGY